MNFTQLTYEIQNRIARITLNRPEQRNALTSVLISELRQALRDADSEPDVRVVMLQSTGKAFCAGLDLSELGKISEMSALENLADSEQLALLFRQMYTHRKLVISKVQGLAVAGGCGLATAADIIVADVSNAKFCYTETRIGFVPAIVSALILRKSRNAGVREMLLRANMISATEALRLGLINYAVPSNELDAATEKIAEEICTGTSPASIELTKRLLWSVETMSGDDALNFAVSMNALSRTTEDLKKGVGAFLNKEKISW